MRFTILLSLLSVSLAAQTINPNQIRPSATNGQIVTTVGGVTVWAAPSSTAPSFSTVTGGTNPNALLVGGTLGPTGSGAITATTLSTPGTTTTVLHGNASGPPTYSGVNLATDIVGNLPTGNLNSGTAAGPTTFWRGDGTWAVPSGGGSGGLSGQTTNCVPKANSATTSTSSAAICDSGTAVTISEPTTINDSSGKGGGFDAVEGTAHTGGSLVDNLWADSTAHRFKMINNNGSATNIPGVATAGTAAHLVAYASNGIDLVDGGAPGAGTVTAVTGTSPIVSSGGATPAISCATCVIASSPGAGIAHFAGSTQTVTSSPIVAADITNNTITGTQLAPSLALVTPSIGAATGTSLLASGTVDGTAPVTITTGTSATLGGTFKSGYTFNQEATAATAVAYTLPTAAAGLQYCVGNSWNGSAAATGVLTVNASASGQFIIFTDGTLSATGGNVTSGGAAADFACFVGVDSTHWYFKPSSGTWAKH